ncbi:MAG TPA: hypothetical protein VFC09_02285 [Candidatus Dormibacteraeota bacterium]|nr:hypothetical protein [Candidatus Dormibacteraeota bacterium]
MTAPSTVAYLFADRFVLTAKPGTKGMKAFGTGAVVATDELAAGLVAIALWQLREMGAVTLEEYHTKKLGLISTNGVRITLLGIPEVGGVEKAVLHTVASWKKSRDAGVSAWDAANMVCRNGRDPNGHVIRFAIDDAVEQGYLERVPQEVSTARRLTGTPSTVLQPVTEKLATLKDAADDLAVRWRDVRQGAESTMVKLLRSTTYDGIQAQARNSRESILDD